MGLVLHLLSWGILATTEDVWTLDRAVEQALDQNPRILEAQGKISESKEIVRRTISEALPSAESTFSLQQRKDSTATGGALFDGESYNAYSFQITGRQPLFEGLKNWELIRGAGTARDLQDLNFSITRRDVLLDVVSGFYLLILEQNKLEILKEQKRIQQSALKFAARRVRLGTGRELEKLQIETELRLLEPEILSTKSAIEVAAAALANLLSLRSGAQLTVRGALDVPSMDDLMTQVQEDRLRPEILEAQARIDLERVEKGIALSEHLPSVFFTGSWGRRATKRSDLLDDDRTEWAFGLEVEIPLFSSFSSFFEREEYNARLYQLRAQELQVRDEAALEMITARKQMNVTKEVIEASQKALALASEALDEAQKDYRIGRIEYTQLVDVQRTQLESAIRLEEAKYEYIQRLADFFKAAGEPLEPLVKTLAMREGSMSKDNEEAE